MVWEPPCLGGSPQFRKLLFSHHAPVLILLQMPARWLLPTMDIPYSTLSPSLGGQRGSASESVSGEFGPLTLGAHSLHHAPPWGTDWDCSISSSGPVSSQRLSLNPASACHRTTPEAGPGLSLLLSVCFSCKLSKLGEPVLVPSGPDARLCRGPCLAPASCPRRALPSLCGPAAETVGRSWPGVALVRFPSLCAVF